MDRRRFFYWASSLLSAAYVAFLALPAIKFLQTPLKESGKKAKRHRLAKLNDLEIGAARKVVVIDQRTDAWTKYPAGPIGSVWLVRRDEETVEAFSATCPHLGCAVQQLAAENQFYCPCHEAQFKNDGTVESGPSRRGLDALKVSKETVNGEQWVSVVFQKFELGSEEKVPLG